MTELIAHALTEYLLEHGFLATGQEWDGWALHKLNVYQASGARLYVGCILLDETVAHVHGRQLEYANPRFTDLLDREIAIWHKGEPEEIPPC